MMNMPENTQEIHIIYTLYTLYTAIREQYQTINALTAYQNKVQRDE